MRYLKELIERMLARFLAPVVEVHDFEPSVWSKSAPPAIPIQFAVLTPAVQRALDRSA